MAIAQNRDASEAQVQTQALGVYLSAPQSRLTQLAVRSQRNDSQAMARQLKLEQAAASAREQQARNREASLSQDLQTEEARWSDLVSRLEALTQR